MVFRMDGSRTLHHLTTFFPRLSAIHLDFFCAGVPLERKAVGKRRNVHLSPLFFAVPAGDLVGLPLSAGWIFIQKPFCSLLCNYTYLTYIHTYLPNNNNYITKAIPASKFPSHSLPPSN